MKGTSCPADNKCRLSDKKHLNVCGNTCASFLVFKVAANWRKNEALDSALDSCARQSGGFLK